MRIKTIQTSNKNFILKYFRYMYRDGKRTETRIGMEGIHSLYTVYLQHKYLTVQEWVIQIPSIPILVSVLFPSLHLKYFRIKFLLLVYMYATWLVWCGMRNENRPTASRGRVSYPQEVEGWSEVSTPFL